MVGGGEHHGAEVGDVGHHLEGMVRESSAWRPSTSAGWRCRGVRAVRCRWSRSWPRALPTMPRMVWRRERRRTARHTAPRPAAGRPRRLVRGAGCTGPRPMRAEDPCTDIDGRLVVHRARCARFATFLAGHVGQSPERGGETSQRVRVGGVGRGDVGAPVEHTRLDGVGVAGDGGLDVAPVDPFAELGVAPWHEPCRCRSCQFGVQGVGAAGRGTSG